MQAIDRMTCPIDSYYQTFDYASLFIALIIFLGCTFLDIPVFLIQYGIRKKFFPTTLDQDTTDTETQNQNANSDDDLKKPHPEVPAQLDMHNPNTVRVSIQVVGPLQPLEPPPQWNSNAPTQGIEQPQWNSHAPMLGAEKPQWNSNAPTQRVAGENPQWQSDSSLPPSQSHLQPQSAPQWQSDLSQQGAPRSLWQPQSAPQQWQSHSDSDAIPTAPPLRPHVQKLASDSELPTWPSEGLGSAYVPAAESHSDQYLRQVDLLAHSLGVAPGQWQQGSSGMEVTAVSRPQGRTMKDVLGPAAV
jgi:hypothetical protein